MENGKNPISGIIVNVLFGQKEVRFKSYFMTRVQFDSNSCGAWLIAAMAGYVHSLPNHQWEMMLLTLRLVYLNERKNFEMKMLSLKFLHVKSEDHIKIYTSAQFLIDVLKNNPANSLFHTKVLTKGIRSNYFYITETTKCPMSHITADNNGAYVKTRNTNKLYCEVR